MTVKPTIDPAVWLRNHLDDPVRPWTLIRTRAGQEGSGTKIRPGRNLCIIIPTEIRSSTWK